MKQRYHTIIKPEDNGWYVGWVEEMPGTMTAGHSLAECQRNLKEALELMVTIHRDEALCRPEQILHPRLNRN